MQETTRLGNAQIVTLALFLAGGQIRPVDTEDIAIKSNELAPGRFTWKKYPDQINLELIRVFLSDAKKPSNGTLVRGSGTKGWSLTSAGLEFSNSSISKLKLLDLTPPPLSAREQAQYEKERRRLNTTVAFSKFHSGAGHTISKRDAEALFRLDDYIVGAPRQRKIERLKTMFFGDPQLRSVLEFTEQILRNNA